MDIVPDASEPISGAQTVEDKTMTDAPLPIVKAESMVESAQLEDMESALPEVWIHLKMSWAGKSFELEIAESDRIDDLKSLLFSLTDVPPERQKILGLVKGKLPPEEESIRNLKLVSGKKFSLVGTPVGNELKAPSKEELPDVFNDLDVDLSKDPQAARAYVRDRRNQRKIREATEKLQVNLMHPLREGKRLLVLDIDYTIVDTRPLIDGSLPPTECARPHLHEFLEAVYPFYDICIWSQTSWVWLETKLHELGMVGGSRRYKINFVLDKTCMFKVFSKRNGQDFSHHVKALQVIWNKYPQFNAGNTIHIDDLSRNFALNPAQGLKISPFKDAHNNLGRQEDKELKRLARYLLFIAQIKDFRDVNHSEWKRVIRGTGPAS